MPQISIIKKSDIHEARRFDAEFFKPEYLEIERKLREIKSRKIEALSRCTNYGLNIEPEYRNEGVKFIRAQNLKEYSIEGKILKIPVKIENLNETEILDKGDLMIVRSGANVGDIGVVTDEYKKSTFGSYIIKFDIKENINSIFAYIFLKTKFGRLQTIRFRSGTAQPNISIPNLNEILIPNFDNNFQKEIEKKYFEAIEKQTQSKQLYKEAEEALLKEVGLLDYKPEQILSFQTTKNKTVEAKRFDAEYFQPKYEEIIKKIEKYKNGFDNLKYFIKDYSTGFPFKSDSYVDKGCYLIRINNIEKGKLNLENANKIPIDDKELSKKDIAKENDILISMSGTIGNACKIPKGIKAVINQRIFRFTPKNFDEEVLTLLINSIVGLMQLNRIGTGGVQTNISGNDIIKIKIPLIKPQIQKQIAEKIQESHKLRKESKELLEEAKKRVEEEIEKEARE